ncbi:MAG TPA: glycosyl hydrolase 53 family protein [Pseudonocardiaceae bacterium]|nr:glycosyl hydrolase 53 family protein [Pseudonocardiaceae bacterium]
MAMPSAIPMYCFVINLGDDTERMALITAHLSTVGMSFERWPATEAAMLDYALEARDGIVIREFGPWAAGEAACGMSHIRLWRHIIERRISWAIVLEDDARLRGPVPFDVAEWDLPPDADIVLLNRRACAGVTRHRGQRFCYADVTGGAGTEGYIVSQAGAAKLLAITQPLKDPLDFQMYAHFDSVRRSDRHPFFWALPRNPVAKDVSVTAYRIVPDLVEHADVESSIGNRRHARARFYCRLLLGVNFDHDYYYCGYAGTQSVSPDVVTRNCRSGYESVDSHFALTENVFIRGVDISHCREEKAESVTKILAAKGADTVRLSVWVDDRSALNLARGLRLARAATTAGLQLYLTLHYSDGWADPGRQPKPKAWQTFGVRALIDQVESYTQEVVSSFCHQGTPPSVVQLGNEITNGLLWAEDGHDERGGGRLHSTWIDGASWRGDDQWIVLSELLNAAVAGAREGFLSSEVGRVMLHLDRGADLAGTKWWLDRATAMGIDYDLIGLSFYSLWHDNATIATLARVRELQDSYPSKPVVISETAHPYRPFWDGKIMRAAGLEFAFTPAGQFEYLEAALRTIRGAPNGAGLFWWGACFTDSSLEPCPDCFRAHALFDAQGNPLPALAAFGAVP